MKNMTKFKKTIRVRGKLYERIPVKTHLVYIKEPYLPLIEKYVLPKTRPNDWLMLSEKVIAYSQGRVVHESIIHPGWFAKFISLGVKKYPNDLGFSHPMKIQVAIMQVGWPRMLMALIIGSIAKLFGRHGDFYQIAGHDISQIDGFNPPAIPPFNEFAKLGPEDPTGFCQIIEDKYGLPAIIVDSNNIDTAVLGMSKKVPVSREAAREISLDNPLGQDKELTPIVIVRKIK